MNIFRLTHTLESPPICSTPDPDFFAEKVLMNLDQLKADVVIGDFQLGDPNLNGDGFYRLGNSVLVFSREIYLGPLGYSLNFSGNAHPAKINGTDEDIFFLNVTAVYNCIDIENTIFFKPRGEEMGVDHGMGVKKPAFFSKLIGDSSIFRVPQMMSTIFVASNGLGYEEDFYTLYRSSGIRGLLFEKVWSDEE